MKRCSRFFIITLLLSLPLLAEVKEMSVQVKESTVRASPSFLGKIFKRVKYADTLSVLGERGGWASIALPGGQKGWIHASALSEKKIVLRSSTHQASTAASSDEIMLAGKGFSAEVEADYRSKNASLDYDRVDAMERYTVSEKTQVAFIREGLLSVEGGAR